MTTNEERKELSTSISAFFASNRFPPRGERIDMTNCRYSIRRMRTQPGSGPPRYLQRVPWAQQ